MNEIPKPSVPAPDIIRCAAMDLVVTDLAASRAFYVDVLGLHVTEEDDEAIYLRSFEEFIHHNLVLRKGPVAAVAAFAYRVRTPEDVDAASAASSSGRLPSGRTGRTSASPSSLGATKVSWPCATGCSGCSAALTSAWKRKRTASSLMASIIAWNSW